MGGKGTELAGSLREGKVLRMKNEDSTQPPRRSVLSAMIIKRDDNSSFVI